MPHNKTLDRTAMSAVSEVIADSWLAAALMAVGQLCRWARADQAHTNTDVMKPNPEPKPTVVEPLVGLLSGEIIS